jgi:hypothetical protein
MMTAGRGPTRIGTQDYLRRLPGHRIVVEGAERDRLSVWHSTTSTVQA